VVFGNLADLAQQIEHGQHGPRSDLDLDAEAFRNDARHVIGDTASSDMGGTLKNFGFGERLNGLEIAPMNLEQFLGDGAPQFGNMGFRRMPRDFEKQLSRERVPVGVKSSGR